LLIDRIETIDFSYRKPDGPLPPRELLPKEAAMALSRLSARPAAPRATRPLARRVASLLGLLLGRLRYELALRRDIQHLERLDDAQLADLGLSRGAIVGAVRGQYDPHG